MVRILTHMSTEFMEGWINELLKRGYKLVYFTATPAAATVFYHVVMEKEGV
jgi:hypothetical protein